MLLALAAPPVLVRHLSALCPPSVVGFGRASSPCPPLVHEVSPMCPPCVLGFGRIFNSCSPCVGLVLLSFARLVPALCSWPLLQSLLAACHVRLYSVWILFTVGPSCVRHCVRSASLYKYVRLSPGLFVYRFRRDC